MAEEERIYEVCSIYRPSRAEELILRPNSVVKVIEDAGNGFFRGIVDGLSGLFPKDNVRTIVPCRAKINRDKLTIKDIPIGAGASAQVFEAAYEGKEVAFKKFELKYKEGDRLEDIIEKAIHQVNLEASRLSRLNHVNVVVLYGICLAPHDSIGLVLELCKGGPLSGVLRSLGSAPLPTRIIVDWAVQIAVAMETVAGQKFFHRDLKLDNVLVLQKACLCALPERWSNRARAGTAGACCACGGTALDRLTLKLTDFGLSRDNNLDASVQSSTGAAGTSIYMAPEVFINEPGKGGVLQFSDVWSFGVLLWELITRLQPYGNIAVHNIQFGVANGSLHLETTEHFPVPLATLIQDCLQYEPTSRPEFRNIRKRLVHYKENEMSLDECVDLSKIQAVLKKEEKSKAKLEAGEDASQNDAGDRKSESSMDSQIRVELNAVNNGYSMLAPFESKLVHVDNMPYFEEQYGMPPTESVLADSDGTQSQATDPPFIPAPTVSRNPDEATVAH